MSTGNPRLLPQIAASNKVFTTEVKRPRAIGGIDESGCRSPMRTASHRVRASGIPTYMISFPVGAGQRGPDCLKSTLKLKVRFFRQTVRLRCFRIRFSKSFDFAFRPPH